MFLTQRVARPLIGITDVQQQCTFCYKRHNKCYILRKNSVLYTTLLLILCEITVYNIILKAFLARLGRTRQKEKRREWIGNGSRYFLYVERRAFLSVVSERGVRSKHGVRTHPGGRGRL